VRGNEAIKVNVHAARAKVESGQLPSLGSSRIAVQPAVIKRKQLSKQ